jgi:predicted esterase
VDVVGLLRRVRGAPKRAGALIALVLASGVIYATRGTGGSDEAAEESLDGNARGSSWCAEGLEPIAGDACYAAPSDSPPRASLPLLIYLHGLFEKGSLEDEERDRQRRVACQATGRGFAVLALRGAEGACTTTPERARLVCWPSNERTADKADLFVLAWEPALKAAAKRHSFEREYVLGFSNGGFFAGLVAERGLYKAQAFAIAHAGPVEPVKGIGNKPPLLLLSADDDLSQEGMVRLDDELTRDEWPHAHYVREGGHALPDSDIDVALTFFERTRTESLPLRPPLSSRVPRARSAPRHDAEDAPRAGTEAPTTAPSASALPLMETDPLDAP